VAAVERVVAPAEVKAFRARHGLTGKALDRLLGFRSDGRSARRWEEVGAPGYVAILFAYADRYGIDLLKEIADAREKP
jgi:hypothetical protein